MKTKLITSLLASLLMTGFACAQEQTSTAAPAATASASSSVPADSCCAPKSSCAPKESCSTTAADMSCAQSKKGHHDVLTKEERHRFCCAKTAAIAANPALAAKGNKKALCDAICKQDPTMKPIMEKLRKHCEEMRKKAKAGAVSPTS